MEITSRTEILKKMYALYDAFCAGITLACRKGCALCCTANVTLTSLEALLILQHWRASGQNIPVATLTAAAQAPRFQPRLTINQLATLCAQGQDPPDEAADPQVGPCPLLVADRCTIYTVRPFGCRAMVSRSDCAGSGAADMPDTILSANNLIFQYIEAADAQGISGNLIDILLFLDDADRYRALEDGANIDPPPTMAANRPIPVLMIPPEHRQKLQPLLQAVLKTVHMPCG